MVLTGEPRRERRAIGGEIRVPGAAGCSRVKGQGGERRQRGCGSVRPGENEESEGVTLPAAPGTRREAGFIPYSPVPTSVSFPTPPRLFLSLLKLREQRPPSSRPKVPGAPQPLDTWGWKGGEPGSRVLGSGYRKGAPARVKWVLSISAGQEGSGGELQAARSVGLAWVGRCP